MTGSKMTTMLWFADGEARHAAEFYARTFPDSHVGSAFASPSETPSVSEGEELVVDFTLFGQSFASLNGGRHGFSPNESVSFQVFTDDQAETDKLWNTIVGNGGAESECGWCKDKWGFSWQITPRALMKAIANPDKAAAKRAMQAMMTMKKIDIAAIEAAAGAPANA